MKLRPCISFKLVLHFGDSKPEYSRSLFSYRKENVPYVCTVKSIVVGLVVA